jgi:hypothetical protein
MPTTPISDSARLLRDQYKDGSNLSARIRLYQRFSTYMRAAFTDVTLERYPDSLVITEAAPLMDCICSMRVRNRITDEQIAALRDHVENEIATHGQIRMTKDSGHFIARR